MFTFLRDITIVGFLLLLDDCYCPVHGPIMPKIPLKARDKFSGYYCSKTFRCRHGGKKVCGFHLETNFLAEFEDMCTFYDVNCKGGGKFGIVDDEVCDAKKLYMSQHPNEDFEWIHIRNDTTPQIKNVVSYKYETPRLPKRGKVVSPSKPLPTHRVRLAEAKKL